MSRNISLLSGKKDDKNSLFGKISVSPNETSDAQLAGEYNLGVSTIHSTKSFYDFLSEDFKNKKAYVCTGSACMCRGTQEDVTQKLKSKFGQDAVGEMICLGRCYENSAFYYNGENYSGDDINQLDDILSGNHKSTPYTMKSFSETSFLVEDEVFSTYKDFKDLLETCFQTDKNDLIDTLNNNNPTENVVVMVLSLSDSVLLGFDRTDFNGEFSISGLPVDTVEIIMSHHNFDDKVIFFMGSNANNELNLINTILPDKSEMINEVTIYANKEPIYFRGDTLVYVADSFKTKQNAVVEDLLKKLPGIDVDKNGTITSQGLAVNKILVDGDEFFGDDPTVATKNLGAKTVESVNIYEEENKDESETAEETIQVMDLRLKEGSKKGYFGKISGASLYIKL